MLSDQGLPGLAQNYIAFEVSLILDQTRMVNEIREVRSDRDESKNHFGRVRFSNSD
jgi:hypothetical protein